MKHPNYEILNLIGYGLAKFNISFVNCFGFKTKISFFEYVVSLGIAETKGTIKNRQDLFDPFFNNDRKGWWQKGETYINRKIVIDSLFGDLNVEDYSKIVKLHLGKDNQQDDDKSLEISPIIKSKYKQLQLTGLEAETYFIHNFNKLTLFNNGKIEDARLYGDGYDFQIETINNYYLAEVKGIREKTGQIRFTQKEYLKAIEYKENYILTVVFNLIDSPKISLIPNPVNELKFIKKDFITEQFNYISEKINW